MNKKTTISLFIAAVVLFTAASADAKFSRDQRTSDAQTLVAMFENRYAPVQWKKDYLGISLDDLTSNLMSEIYREDISDAEFYAAMARFSGGVKDTHNWFIIPSTLTSYLGFVTDYVEGKVLIESVDREILPEEKFPFVRGDELISIDGEATEDIMARLSEFCSEGNEIAEKRFLAYDITNRRQRYYPEIPTGESTIEVFSQERGAKESVTLEWQTWGNPLAGETSSDLTKNAATRTTQNEGEKWPSPLKRLRWSAMDMERIKGSGIRDPEPFFTLWDSFVERSKEPLYSGMFLFEGKRIGFIRIHTWNPDDSTPWFEFLEKEIAFLEKETDALIIDQTNNGGGWICLGEEVSRFLVTEPIPSNYFQLRANRHMLLSFEEWYNEVLSDDNVSDEKKIVEGILEELRRAIAEGDTLTKPISLCAGDGSIHPYRTGDGEITTYSKPVMMLINEWSISTADMTPAPLQDAGRVVMFGGRTCGAGGNVETTPRIGYSDFQISQTESLTVRPKPVMSPNGIETRYLENVGVIPDVEYQVTVDDFMNGYLGYRQAIENTLREILK